MLFSALNLIEGQISLNWKTFRSFLNQMSFLSEYFNMSTPWSARSLSLSCIGLISRASSNLEQILGQIMSVVHLRQSGSQQDFEEFLLFYTFFIFYTFQAFDIVKNASCCRAFKMISSGRKLLEAFRSFTSVGISAQNWSSYFWSKISLIF